MQEKLIQELKSFLSEDQILTESSDLSSYGKDWLSFYTPNALGVVFPKKTEDVCKLVQWAIQNKIALIPSGGRTGLSGGATALHRELIVSFEKMNQLMEWNELEQTFTVEAGFITSELQRVAKEKGYYFPISFGAEGSSQIGGNVATNAGGVHVIRYGMMRRWIRALEVVTGTGEVLNLGRHLIKDATGYNLLQLLIGSEGTLGFITKITVEVTASPPSLNVFLLGLSSLKDVVNVYSKFKKDVSLHAFEMMTDLALHYVQESGAHFPLSSRSAYYVLMEIPEEHQEKAFALFEELMNKGQIEDGTVSQSFEQAQQIWSLRENISESLTPYKPYKNDVSVRISKLPQFLTQVDELLKKEYPEYKVVWFGHVGDGNLHINILKPKDVEEAEFIKNCERVNTLLFSKIKEFEGSISAEHGVGLLKKNHLHYSRSENEIQYMKQIKKIFDPHHIINPGKIIDKTPI